MKTSLLTICLATLAVGQTVPPYVALGDSLGQGVQSADANLFTQTNAYPSLIAKQMRVNFSVPLIWTTPFAVVGNVAGRGRVFPDLPGTNLAVSGADTTSILRRRAGSPIQTETDLVLHPRTGSQVEIAEALRAPFMTCWIGNNDALEAVLSYDQLDATQLTPLPVFTANFREIAQRLTRWNNKVVFANIPNVTEIGFLVDRQDLIRLTGSDHGLPVNSYTTIVAAVQLKLGLADARLLRNPNWVLDPSEVQTIRNAIDQFNQVIAKEAAAVNMPVVNIRDLVAQARQNGIVIGGQTLTTRYLGGLFSLDGVHPSNIGHAIVANEFIRTANAFFGMNTPLLNGMELATILFFDPFVDFDHDQMVPGRPFLGLVETLAPFLGISGDFNQFPSGQTSKLTSSAASRFMQKYFNAKGVSPSTSWTQTDAIEAVGDTFGLKRSSGN